MRPTTTFIVFFFAHIIILYSSEERKEKISFMSSTTKTKFSHVENENERKLCGRERNFFQLFTCSKVSFFLSLYRKNLTLLLSVSTLTSRLEGCLLHDKTYFPAGLNFSGVFLMQIKMRKWETFRKICENKYFLEQLIFCLYILSELTWVHEINLDSLVLFYYIYFFCRAYKNVDLILIKYNSCE